MLKIFCAYFNRIVTKGSNWIRIKIISGRWAHWESLKGLINCFRSAAWKTQQQLQSSVEKWGPNTTVMAKNWPMVHWQRPDATHAGPAWGKVPVKVRAVRVLLRGRGVKMKKMKNVYFQTHRSFYIIFS